MSLCIFWSLLNGLGLGIEHLGFKGGFSVIATLAFLRLHFVFMESK